MSRNFGMLAGLAVVLLIGTHAAKAQNAADNASYHRHRAPAPLLAAGIPAFAALGGGVFFSRLFRRTKPRD